MTDKVNPSINRPAEAFKTAGAIAYAGGERSGFIVPANSPTEISIQDNGISESNLNAFNYSTSNLDVTVDGGEAFVFGSWLAVDTQTTVTLDDNTTDQTIFVGWNKDGTDDVIIGLQRAFDNASGNTDQKIPIATFDTSGSSVSNSTDNRVIGNEEQIQDALTFVGKDTLPEGRSLTIESDEYIVAGGSFTLNGDATIDGDLVTVQNQYSHDQLADVDPTDHLSVEKEYQVTLSSGNTPAFDGTLSNVLDEQLAAFDVTVTPTNGLDDTYAFNFDDGKAWNNGSWDVPITVNWDDDPGSDLDVSVRVHRRSN